MIYIYKCDKCNKVYEVSKPLKDVNRIECCIECNNILHRIYQASSVIIPEHLKAENIQDTSWVNSQMRKRPSGKEQVIF